jgi:hypothetical protein
MVDTVRTVAALQALLANNTTGDISAQDLRDFLVSASPPHGTMYRNVASATTISVIGTYYKMAGTTTAGNLKDFDMPVDGRLRYTGAAAKHCHIVISVSFTVAGNNDVVGLKCAKNGTVMDESVQRRFVGTGTDIGSTAVHADAMLSTNDYLELWVANETATENITVDELYFFVMGMLT